MRCINLEGDYVFFEKGGMQISFSIHTVTLEEKFGSPQFIKNLITEAKLRFSIKDKNNSFVDDVNKQIKAEELIKAMK